MCKSVSISKRIRQSGAGGRTGQPREPQQLAPGMVLLTLAPDDGSLAAEIAMQRLNVDP
jgi:hypothetical protein